MIARGSTTRPWVSLTFDAGGVDRSGPLLDILRARHISSTWFLESEWAQAHPDKVARVVGEGHEIGNHTVDHPDLVTPPRSDAFICTELTTADRVISGLTGRTTRPFFRPPYGSYNDQVRTLAARLGYRTVMWTIDTIDWDDRTTKQDILNRIFNSGKLGPGAIILMHAGSLHEAEALPDVIAGLQARGYQIVTLGQLVA